MYRTILVHVDTADGAAERTRLAADLAQQFDATLIGITAGLPQLPIQMASAAWGVVAVGADYSEADREFLRSEFARAGEIFKNATKGTSLETDWLTVIQAPSVAISQAAAGVDLIVVGSGDQSLIGGFDAPSPGDIVLHCGRPVLVAPAGHERLKVQNAVVAWKNTPEAQRALADALPLLKSAKVAVVQVDEGDGAAPAAEPVSFLLRHGIAAKLEVLKAKELVEHQIIAFAERSHADLIVAGAYGRTRLSEWIFGGVTRDLLRRSPVPCLFAH